MVSRIVTGLVIGQSPANPPPPGEQADRDYELRPLAVADADLAEVAALLHQVFPAAKHLNAAYLKWLYRDNPAGKVIGHNAYHEGRLVAHYAVVPQRYELFGQPEDGVLSLNSATHPGHAGRGLFSRLASLTFDQARIQGKVCVVGVANQNSTDAFVRKLAFSTLAPLELRLVLKVPRQCHATPGVALRTLYSKESLAWRLGSPRGHYRGRPGVAGTWLVTRLHPGLPVNYLLDCRPSEDLRNLGLPSVGHGPGLTFWLGLAPEIDWSSAIAPCLPRLLRPAPFNLIFKDLTGKNRVPPADQSRCTGLDFDVF